MQALMYSSMAFLPNEAMVKGQDYVHIDEKPLKTAIA